MKTRSLLIGVFLLIGSFLLAPTANATNEGLVPTARPRPPICNEIFKNYQEAVRRCRDWGINRRYDGWKFVGYGCDCSIFDEPYFPQRPGESTPFGWDF